MERKEKGRRKEKEASGRGAEGEAEGRKESAVGSRQPASPKPRRLGLGAMALATNVFPLTPERELQRLADDIAANGQLEPIFNYQEKILVEWQRALAAAR